MGNLVGTAGGQLGRMTITVQVLKGAMGKKRHIYKAQLYRPDGSAVSWDPEVMGITSKDAPIAARAKFGRWARMNGFVLSNATDEREERDDEAIKEADSETSKD